MSTIPTLTIRLLDIPLRHDPAIMSMLLVGAGEEVASALKKKKQRGIDPSLFHNGEMRYSGIQIARYQGAVEYMAIGEDEARTLDYWYELFRESNGHQLQNTIEIHERYTPAFLPELKKYRVRTLLINDALAVELNDLTDRFARIDKLEKYIYGNLHTFFKHIGFSFDTRQHFLKVVIDEVIPYDHAMPVYHGQKKTAMDIVFQCNFRLPQALRIGQSTAIGYGKVT